MGPMPRGYEHIAERQRYWDGKLKSLLGTVVRVAGKSWCVAAINDLGVPYFTRPGRKTLYVLLACVTFDELYDLVHTG